MKGRKKLYELTPEHREQLAPWRDRWIANQLSTSPMGDADRDAMRVAVNGLHEAANLPPPDRIVFCASPIGGAIAASVASGVWWLRENPSQHKPLFGRALTEADLALACRRAVAFAVARGIHMTRTLRPLPAPAVRPSRSAATWAATEAATRAATGAATRAATWDATGAATRAATWAATEAATWDATGAATRAATWDATGAATRTATGAATEAATRAATWDATGAATGAATEAATGAATRAATEAATWDATGAATRAATWDATWDATGAATRAATWDATGAATWDATRAATRDATVDATRAATVDADPVAMFLVNCSQHWGRFYAGGNFWSGYSAYISFFRHIAGLNLPEYERWQHFEAASIHAGPRFMHAKFCIISDRPTVIAKDDRNRPHREDGPFIAWRDGWALYAWHGTRVPADWIENKAALDPKTALTHENIEQRRAAAEIVGWAKILEHVEARVVDTDDPEIGTLYEADLPDAPRSKFLEVKCGTGRRFVLPVPGEMKTALQANSWTYDVPQVDVKKLEERT